MGNTSSGGPMDESGMEDVTENKGKGRPKKAIIGKRKAKDSNNPKSKKAKLETAKYVYDKLFVEGQDSDISINALGYRWKLHKFYLKQCDYFCALLDGEWADSNATEFNLEIPDENVTKDGLHSVLGALYDNEIVFEVKQLRSIVATASFLQMRAIFDKASDAMLASINDKTVLQFLECGYKYEIDELTMKAFEYLRCNFWRISKEVEFLQKLPFKALESLMACNDMPVVEGEMDIYKSIRTWIFLKESNSWTGSAGKALDLEITKYFSSLKSEWENDYDSVCSTPSSNDRPSPSSCDEINDGFRSNRSKQPHALFLKYSSLFAGLRLHSMCCSIAAINLIQEDGLLPHSLIDAVLADRYVTQLAIDEQRTTDPDRQLMDDVADEAFLLSCTRLGRFLGEADLPKCWRWTGSHFGVDLLMNVQSTLITMKRNVFTQPNQQTTYSLNLRNKVAISYRATILSANGTIIKDTEKTTVLLSHDACVVIARFAKGELPPKFSVHMFVMFGSPPPNPSFVLVRNAVNQIKQLSKPILQMDNVSLNDEDEDEKEENEDDEEVEDASSTEKSTESDEDEQEL